MRDSEILLRHLLSQPVNLPSRVAEDDCLCDSESVIEVTKSFELPFFPFHHDIELFDTFQSEFFFLDKDLDRIPHEPFGDFKDIIRHSGRQEDDLSVFRERFEHVINLILEPSRQHFISFIKDENFYVIRVQGSPGDHVIDTTRSSNHDVDS